MTNLQQIIQKLKSEGKTEGEITTIVESLTKIALVKCEKILLDLAKENESSEEFSKIEAILDDKEREVKMIDFYQNKTGRTFDQIINAKIEEVAKEYLDKLDSLLPS